MARLVERLRREPLALVLVLALGVLLVLAFVVPAFAGTDPNRQDLTQRLIEPSWDLGDPAVLGTDQLGRPLWIRLLYGLRTSYVVAVSAVAVGFVIGVTGGLVAGFKGGLVDAAIMRLADIQLSLPSVLLVMLLVALIGGGVLPLVLMLGLNTWMLFARVSRSVVVGLREHEFVAASRAVGSSGPRIVTRHLFPNTLPAVLAAATVELANIMLTEAGLSFLGFGIEPPDVSLGAMLAEGREYLASQWWLAVLPGVLLALAVLLTNLVANWVRLVMDPARS